MPTKVVVSIYVTGFDPEDFDQQVGLLVLNQGHSPPITEASLDEITPGNRKVAGKVRLDAVAIARKNIREGVYDDPEVFDRTCNHWSDQIFGDVAA